MKLYRVQARYIGAYLDHKLEADNDELVIPNFINDLNAGKVKVQKENTGRTPKLCLVTYEEIEHDRIISVASSQEDKPGVQMEPILSRER
jgi:hypothetical protein